MNGRMGEAENGTQVETVLERAISEVRARTMGTVLLGSQALGEDGRESSKGPKRFDKGVHTSARAVRRQTISRIPGESARVLEVAAPSCSRELEVPPGDVLADRTEESA